VNQVPAAGAGHGASRGSREPGPGTIIGSYRIEQRIGRGGMAVVYRARDERLHRDVALKLLAPALTRNTAFRARFSRESLAAAAVDHPNVLPVYDAGEHGGFLFIAMRYVHGGDARSLLRQAGTLSAQQTWDIVRQIAAALDAAHSRDLVHRDVKPANVLLDSVQPAHAYLTDFGVSKQLQVATLTATGQIVGTLDYISPEQIEGVRIDGRADQYSLACATFELLCGVPPFRRRQGQATIYAQLSDPPPSLAQRQPGVPPAVDHVLARALAKAPAERYGSCGQFSTRLGAALGLLAGHPATDPIGPPGAEPRTRLAGSARRPVMPPGSLADRAGIEPPTRRKEN
jgi:serine/threonine-protein kinase